MRCSRIALLAAAAFVAVLLAGCGGGHRHLVVGGVEDSAKWADPGGNMALAGRAGFRVIVLSSVWADGARAPTASETYRLRTAIDVAQRIGIQPIVAVYSFSGDTPLTSRARAVFTAYAAAIRVRSRRSATSAWGTSRTRSSSGCRSSARRLGCGRDGLPRAARDRLPGDEEGEPRRDGDRRLARGAVERPAAGPPPDPLPRGSSRISARRSGPAAFRGRRSTSSRSIPIPPPRRSLPRPPTPTRPRSGSPTTPSSCSC